MFGAPLWPFKAPRIPLQKTHFESNYSERKIISLYLMDLWTRVGWFIFFFSKLYSQKICFTCSSLPVEQTNTLERIQKVCLKIIWSEITCQSNYTCLGHLLLFGLIPKWARISKNQNISLNRFFPLTLDLRQPIGIIQKENLWN